MRLTLAGGSPGAGASLLAVPRRTALLGAYTATTIVAGFGALVIATALLLVSPDAGLRSDIAIGGLDPSVAGAAGVAIWIAYALAGGTRMLRDPGGHATLTFHLPFIAAATILGGPVAGAWVAALGTVGAEQFDAFFRKYEFKLGMEYGGKAKAPVADRTVVSELTTFCKTTIQC